MAEIKFCGMTRREDVAAAKELGADYVGVIFAGGPRHQTIESAAALLRDADPIRRVAVIAGQTPAEIAALVSRLGLFAVQLHADPTPQRIRDVTSSTEAEVWAVMRIENGKLPDNAPEIASLADAVVLDAKVAGGLGGTGVTLPWVELSNQLDSLRETKVVLAGGLRAENVGEAIATIGPDVVDVSSGVESAPGIKDHSRMRAFRDAVRKAEMSIKR